MRVVLEIVHPADVLFFKRPIDMLRDRGDDLLILSRHKDIACDLLDEFAIPHRPISRAGNGVAGLARELVCRTWATYRAARQFRASVMIGFGGAAIAYAGQALRIPAVSFYDSENATIQTRFTWPMISHLYVPASYSGAVPEKRTTRLPGVKELSYLNPSAFQADLDHALAAGLDPTRPNYFVRVVAWRANHDIGKAGWPLDLLRKVVERLADEGKVHLSSEKHLPDDLERYRYIGPKNAVHHVLGHCRALVGESATMASEAAVLGVPAIYAGRDFPGYVQELERIGLVRNVRDFSAGGLPDAIEELLAVPPEAFTATRDSYVAQCPDWASAVVQAIDRYAN